MHNGRRIACLTSEKMKNTRQILPVATPAPQLRLQISTRLRNSDKQEGRAIAANVAKSPKQVNQTGFTAMDVAAAASQLTRDEHDSVLRLDEDPQDVEDGGGEGEELDGAELLDACDRLEQDNLHLRERLAKIELHRLQREHESEQKNDTVDSRIAQVYICRLHTCCHSS